MRLHAGTVAQLTSIKDLSDVDFRVFSQWKQEGIIEWLVVNLPINDGSFVEFGTEDD